MSIKVTNREESEASLARLEENVQSVERERLVLPDGADTSLLLVTDGRLERGVAAPRPVSPLIFEIYKTTFTAGAKGESLGIWKTFT